MSYLFATLFATLFTALGTVLPGNELATVDPDGFLKSDDSLDCKIGAA